MFLSCIFQPQMSLPSSLLTVCDSKHTNKLIKVASTEAKTQRCIPNIINPTNPAHNKQRATDDVPRYTSVSICPVLDLFRSTDHHQSSLEVGIGGVV